VIVTGEQLVSTVPGERNGHLGSGKGRKPVHGKGRNVGEGLVEVPADLHGQLDHVRADDFLDVIRTEMRRNFARVGPLVVGPVRESNREGPESFTPRPAGHRGHDGARIDSPGEKRAEWNVGDEPARDRGFEPFPECVDGFSSGFSSV
jgi:hypothetical protein